MRRMIWAVLLVAMVGCATGGRRMATVTTALSPRRECSWEKEQGRYHTTRYFQIDDIPEIGLQSQDSLLMDSFNITALEDPVATVIMVPVNRTVRSMDATAAGGHRSEITVEYEGHYTGNAAETVGYVRDYPVFSTTSQKTVVDLDGYGIGAKNEGVNRNLGQFEFVVVVNLDAFESAEATYLRYMNELSENGAVNETGFTFQNYGTYHLAYWAEGELLYLGGDSTRNRDGTLTIAHRFRADLTNLHKPKWYYNTKTTPLVIVDGGKTYHRSRIETIGDEISGRIYPVAGTGGLPEFAVLGL